MELRDSNLKPAITNIEQDLPPVKIPDNIKIHDIGMRDFKRLDIPKTDNKIYYLGTKSRSGCDSVLVWRIDPEGKDEILLTHYPPTEINRHREILEQFSPRGEGVMRSVYLTYGTENNQWTHELVKTIEKVTGIKPDVVRTPDITTDTIENEMKYNCLNYQLIAIRGFNGDPNARKIEVPIPKGNAYLKEF